VALAPCGVPPRTVAVPKASSESDAMKTDLAVVFSPVGGGHKAAALATVETARARGMSVELIDLFEVAPRVIGRTYVTAHLGGQTVAPRFYGSAYFAANRRDGAFEPVRRGFDHVVFSGLRKLIRSMDPRAIIATHHLPLVVLGRARRRGELSAPLIGVITDYTAHACWAERGVDAFCVACPLARHELFLHGVRPDITYMTGIPVRAAFEAMPSVVAPSPGGPLRVLLTSGGFGVGPIKEIVQSFAGVRDVELTVVCGSAKGSTSRVRAAAAQAQVNARVLGFERDMPARMAEAHVVVGKAGGLTVSETMASGRPMVIVGTVPGNELYNERLVVDGGAGFAANAHEVGPLVRAMRARGAIEVMGERARGLVVPHAGERVIDVASLYASRLAAAA
jgi:processive 1,2-diacylglycerol beta-glucosyltransferase